MEAKPVEKQKKDTIYTKTRGEHDVSLCMCERERVTLLALSNILSHTGVIRPSDLNAEYYSYSSIWEPCSSLRSHHFSSLLYTLPSEPLSPDRDWFESLNSPAKSPILVLVETLPWLLYPSFG